MFLSDVENMEVLEVLVYFLAMNGISQQARRCYRKGPEINQQSHPTSDQEPLIYHLPTKDPLNGPNGMDSSPNNWLGVFHIRSLIQWPPYCIHCWCWKIAVKSCLTSPYITIKLPIPTSSLSFLSPNNPAAQSATEASHLEKWGQEVGRWKDMSKNSLV